MQVEPRSMSSVMQELREKSPELDRAIQAAAPRQQLALALVGLRRSAGLNQKQLAAAMERDQAHISRMESPAGPWPERDSIEAYAHACKAAAGYVFVVGAGSEASVVTVPLGEPAEGAAIAAALHLVEDEPQSM